MSTNCYHERGDSGHCIKCGALLGALVRLGPLQPMLGTISKAERAGPLEQIAGEMERAKADLWTRHYALRYGPSERP
jgi:hypothetical protein